MKSLKVGFVGCGIIAQEHYRPLSTFEDVVIVGHCDLEKARAEQAAQRYGGEAYTAYEAFFDKAKPQAVYIALPPHTRGPVEIAAAERGIHLFIEKPIALEIATAKSIGAAIRAAKITATVGYCLRYHDTVQRARSLLKGKAISLVRACYHGGLPEVAWWTQREKSGGQIFEQTTHVFDLLRYLCGETAEVQAFASQGCMTKMPEYTIDDSSTVSLRLKQGGVASMTSTCINRLSSRMALEIITPEIVLHLDRTTLRVHYEDRTVTYHNEADMFYEENRAFVDTVLHGKRNRLRSTFADAMKTFYLTHAANESISTGMPVKP